VPNLVQHVVFRLADSLPERIRAEVSRMPATRRVRAVDASLDQGYGRRDLAIPAIAEVVQQALLRFDGDRYAIMAWCVMPNHVHVLIETWGTFSLSHIVHSWKSFTTKSGEPLLKAARRVLGP